MSNLMRNLHFFLFLAFFCSSTILFSNGGTKILCTNEGFSFSIPEYWKEMSSESLNLFFENASRLSNSKDKSKFLYGFRLKTAEDDFQYPYILVQIRRTGKVKEPKPNSQNDFINRLNRSMQKAIDGVNQSEIKKLNQGDPLFDFSSHIVFTQIELDVMGVGKVKGLISSVLTEFGIIELDAYCKSEDFDKFYETFENFARGVILEDRIKYKIQANDGPEVFGRIIGFLVGIGVSITILFNKWVNRNKNEKLNTESNSITKCISCNEELELDKADLENREVTCPACKAVLMLELPPTKENRYVKSILRDTKEGKS